MKTGQKITAASSLFAAAAVSGMLAGAAVASSGARGPAPRAAVATVSFGGLGAPAIKLCPGGNSANCKSAANCSGKKTPGTKPGKD